jgi:hypothetical protein
MFVIGFKLCVWASKDISNGISEVVSVRMVNNNTLIISEEYRLWLGIGSW